MLKSIDWHGQGGGRKGSHLPRTLAQIPVGALAGWALWALGHTTFAAVVWSIACLVGGVSLTWEAGRNALQNGFARVGRLLGGLMSILLLVPIHVVGSTMVRVLRRVNGRDPLRLRHADAPTFWCPCETDRRKLRYVRTSFAPERAVRAGRPILTLLVVLVGLVIASELVLRALGFGNPILYVAGPQAGYFPGPNQDVTRYGGKTVTNSYGMRAPEFEVEKPAENLRILMLGDSTLWGGSYIDQPQLYARRLEGLLNAARKGPGAVEVLNVGVNGWGPFHEMGYVERFGTFGADVAVICLPIADIYRSASGLDTTPFFEKSSPPTFALEEVAWHLLWRCRASRLKGSQKSDLRQRGQIGIRTYLALARKLQAEGCEVLVEILPSRPAGLTGKVEPAERDPVQGLRKALEDAGFKVAFPAGLFEGKGQADELYHDYVHLHWRGHQVYADYLQQRLTKASARLGAWMSPSRPDGGPAGEHQ